MPRRVLKRSIRWTAEILFFAALIFGFRAIPITYTVPIENFSTARDYTKVILASTVLALADSNDTVYINVNSFGGYVTLGFRLVNRILESDAKTIGHNRGMALSMGALVVATCDEVKSSPHALFMFHRMGVQIGPIRRLTPLDDPMNVMAMKHFHVHVTPYLTKKELDRYMKGENVWIQGEEFAKRRDK